MEEGSCGDDGAHRRLIEEWYATHQGYSETRKLAKNRISKPVQVQTM